jgi:hypothetical protein
MQYLFGIAWDLIPLLPFSKQVGIYDTPIIQIQVRWTSIIMLEFFIFRSLYNQSGPQKKNMEA